jgi:hypothetical protein
LDMDLTISLAIIQKVDGKHILQLVNNFNLLNLLKRKN